MSPVSALFPAERESSLHMGALLLAALSVCGAIAGLGAVLAHNFAWALLAHFLSAASGGAAGAIADRRRLGPHFFPWVLAFAMPLFGGSAAYFLLEYMKKPRTGRLLEEYAAYLNEAASYRESVPAVDHTGPTELVSLEDVLARPESVAEQRIAIEYLSEMETQAAFEIMRKAVASAGREAYFFAMTAMTQIEDKMLARLDRLESGISQTGEPGAAVGTLLKAAEAYINFIYYRLADGSRRDEYLKRAEILLTHVLADKAAGTVETGRALILLGRVRLAMNDAGGAAKYFGQYIAATPKSALGYLWRAEAWYRLGKYARLREDCRRAVQAGKIPGAMLPAVDLWLADPGEVQGADGLGAGQRLNLPE